MLQSFESSAALVESAEWDELHAPRIAQADDAARSHALPRIITTVSGIPWLSFFAAPPNRGAPREFARHYTLGTGASQALNFPTQQTGRNTYPAAGAWASGVTLPIPYPDACPAPARGVTLP